MSKFVKVPCYVISHDDDFEDSSEHVIPCSDFSEYCDSKLVESDIIVTKRVYLIAKV